MIGLKKAFLLLPLIFSATLVFSVPVDWTHLDRNLYPWETATDLVEFNGRYYVSAEGSATSGRHRLWRTTDFQVWEAIDVDPTRTLNEITRLLVHNGQLFAFTDAAPDGGGSIGVLRVYRSGEGANWSHIPSPLDGDTSDWGDVESFNGYLFARALTRRETYRTDGNGLTPTWEQVASSVVRGRRQEMYVRGQTLFLAQARVTGWSGIMMLTSIDGENFNPISIEGSIPFNNGYDMQSFTEFEGNLFFAHENLYKISGNQVDPANEMHFAGDYLIYTVHDEIYTKLGSNSPDFQGATFRWDGSGWVQSLGAQFQCFDLIHVPIVRLEDREYTLLCDIWSSKIGAFVVDDEILAPGELEADHSNVALLSWKTDFYIKEKMTQITVVNKGTAEHGSEIDRLKLFRYNLDDPIETPEVYLGEFTNSGGSRTWVSQPDAEFELNEKDVFVIRVDFARENVRIGKSVQLALPENSIQWEQNQTYEMPEIVSTISSMITVLGVQGVNLTPFVDNSLAPGQEERTVLAWSVDYVADESITKLKIRNYGNAIAETDLSRLTLFRESPEAIEFITDLIPSENDPRLWETPDSFNVALRPNSRYFVTADIAPTAEPRSVQLGIPSDGLQWLINDSFALPGDLISDNIQQIEIPAPAAPNPIDGVIVFPNPARDQVRFTYDLSAQSEVTINIFNSVGQLVSEIKETKPQEFGSVITWDARSMAPGVYFAVVDIKSSDGQDRVLKKKVYLKK